MNGNVAIFILLLTVVCCMASQEWQEFKNQHNKTYQDPEEDQWRNVLFEESSSKVHQNNLLFEQGATTALLSVNNFADLTNEEFIKFKLGYNKNSKNVAANSATIKNSTNEKFQGTQPLSAYPVSMDWRTLGAVTPVKDQQQCGSCWAFSAVGALEGQHFKKYNTLVGLSEQQLVDCGEAFDPILGGCNGGLMEPAYDYINANNGIDTEASYPYVAVQNTCMYNSSNIGANCTGYVNILSDENAMLAAVATIGPISVSIGVSQNSGLYSSGLFTKSMCSPWNNHAVVIVGYGVDSNNRKFWIIKNSWGTSWGMGGYFHLPRGSKFCGIHRDPSYPLV